MNESGNIMGWVASGLLTFIGVFAGWTKKATDDKFKEVGKELDKKATAETCDVRHKSIDDKLNTLADGQAKLTLSQQETQQTLASMDKNMALISQSISQIKNAGGE